MAENQNKNQNTENLSEILQIRRDKLTALQEAGQDPFLVTTSERDIMSNEVIERFEELEGKDVCVAGRIMSKRGKGKEMLMDIHDRGGKIQIFAKFDDLGEDVYKGLK